MFEVEPHLYTTVIREMIRHENDVTNHRIMWLLIGQGLIANAYVTAGVAAEEVVSVLAPVGILVSLSAFVILYKSYQARGYLQFLGERAKQGALAERYLPLSGWPEKRIKGWRRAVWSLPWLGKPGHLLEPYLFLPSLLMTAWVFVLLRRWVHLQTTILLLVALGSVSTVLSVVCVFWVWRENKSEDQT